MNQTPLTPVGVKERIATLDALRGFALLGICMVNMQFFALPFMDALRPSPSPAAGTMESAARLFIVTMCEFKFISLFSMMFGMGLVLQMNRAAAAGGGSFVPTYLRRLGVLACIGLLHALLLWYGDILFLYASIGVILLLCRNWSPRTLTLVAGGLVIAILLIQSLFAGIGMMLGDASWMQPPQTADSVAIPAGTAGNGAMNQDESAFFEAASDGSPVAATPAADDEPVLERRHGFALVFHNPDPTSDAWRAAETRAYREGPFIDAFAFRVTTFVFAIFVALFGYGWRVLAMFLLGAAFMKRNFFDASRRAWHLRLALLGLGIGFPMELAYGLLSHDVTGGVNLASLAAVWLHELGSLMLCLGYAGAFTLVAQSGALSWLMRALASVGRLALTNYLAHTVIATSIMYWWGLGMFGEVSRSGQVMLVLAIYLVQMLTSVIWLKLFRIGPAEWLWRSLTYGRAQPALHRDAASAH